MAGTDGAARQTRMPMSSIRFSKDNYNFVKRESALRGMSATAFVNAVMDEYRSDPANVHDNPLYRDVEPH